MLYILSASLLCLKTLFLRLSSIHGPDENFYHCHSSIYLLMMLSFIVCKPHPSCVKVKEKDTARGKNNSSIEQTKESQAIVHNYVQGRKKYFTPPDCIPDSIFNTIGCFSNKQTSFIDVLLLTQFMSGFNVSFLCSFYYDYCISSFTLLSFVTD